VPLKREKAGREPARENGARARKWENEARARKWENGAECPQRGGDIKPTKNNRHLACRGGEAGAKNFSEVRCCKPDRLDIWLDSLDPLKELTQFVGAYIFGCAGL
jgi:hypothetical protein